MKAPKLVFLLIFLFVGFTSFSPTINPLINGLNQPIDFKAITVADIISATEKFIADAKAELETVYNIPGPKRTFQNTVLAVDNINDKLTSIILPINILSNASTDSAVRKEAQKSLETVSKFGNQLGVDEKLYNAYKSYASTANAKQLTGGRKKELKETIENFELNGFALSAEKRKELQQINDKISDLSLAFNKNIASYRDQLLVSEADMKGLPADYIKSRKKDGDKYIITLDGPSYTAFMKYAESESARKALYIKYNNRAADKNLEVLKQLLIERQKKAKLLGFATYAAYQTKTRMAKNPTTVWDFENNLIEKVKEKTAKDLQELIDEKRKYLKDPSVSVMNPWETGFYNNLLMINKYSVDQEKVKEYLPLDNVMDGLFKITQQLFGVKYVQVPDASVWHKDVKAFDVKQNGVTIGRFYLDLFPRDNKFTHAACFPIRKGKQYGNQYQLPVAALLCNFNPPTADKPSFLSHGQAETFFHEFGHVLHNMLTKAELGSQSGTSVKRDFVEAPSQIFENWMWNYDALKLFAKHYKTGELLPKDLFQKMLAAKNVGSGLSASGQVNLGMLDMTLHDKYDPTGEKTTTDVVKEVYNKVMPYKYLEGTNLQAAFGHLDGYGAGYYGYMWSKVYAEDMFSVFEKNGIMDSKTGMRYRTSVLANGGSKDEFEMVKDFLGREPNQKAFLKSLGL